MGVSSGPNMPSFNTAPAPLDDVERPEAVAALARLALYGSVRTELEQDVTPELPTIPVDEGDN